MNDDLATFAVALARVAVRIRRAADDGGELCLDPDEVATLIKALRLLTQGAPGGES